MFSTSRPTGFGLGLFLVVLLAILGGAQVLRADSVVVFSEIHYHPPGDELVEEWIELQNIMSVDMDISGWSLGGLTYTFPEGTIVGGGDYLVVARSPEDFTGLGIDAFGPFSGRLDNSGERLRLFNRSGRRMDTIRYNDAGSWSLAPDGSGHTLAKIDPFGGNRAANWAASEAIGGTPGQPNFERAGEGPRLPTGLVSYWNFDGSGSVVRDQVSGRDGTLGNANPRLPGLVGAGAIGFDNSVDAQINLGSSGFDVTTGVTIEALVVLDWSGDLDDQDMIFRKQDGSSRIVFGFQHDGNDDGLSEPPLGDWTGPVLAFGLNIDGRYRELDLALDGQDGRPRLAELKDGEVHHLAATYDAASGQKRLFIDGRLVFAHALTAGDTISSGGSSSAYIGNMTGRRQAFTGQIDEVAFWERGLDAASIAAHAAAARAGRDYFSDVSTPTGALPPLAFSETLSSEAASWIELENRSDAAIDLGGLDLADGRLENSTELTGEIPAGGFRVIEEAELGFEILENDRLFLRETASGRVIDAVRFAPGLRGRPPEPRADRRDWLYPDEPTPGAANRLSFNQDIVLNEIHYHPRGLPAREERVEEEEIISIEAEWSYHSTPGTPPGWDQPGFDDATWSTGPALLYVENSALPAPKNTELELGAVTYRFRHEFEYSGDLESIRLAIRTVVDDGVLVRLNGEEVLRLRLDEGELEASDFASRSVSNARFEGPFVLPDGALRRGTNLLTAEVHQASAGSGDIVWGCELLAQTVLEEAAPFREATESWIELHNRGEAPIDLEGWSFENGIDFTFGADAVVPAGGYLVLTNDRDHLESLRPGLRVVGNFSGRLSGGNDRLELVDARGNPADEVFYHDSGRWDDLADGGGSSLELVDPFADNSWPGAWQASDETGASEWRQYSYRKAASQAIGPSQWNEFVMGLLTAGEMLIDDLSVIEDPDGTRRQVLSNGDFEDGSETWRIIGNHRHSEVIDDPDEPGNQVLWLRANGPTEHMHNHLESTFAGGARIANGRIYEISWRARWLSGGSKLHTKLYFNRAARATDIDVPRLAGTPGEANSRRVANLGPVLDELRHSPVIPASGEETLVRLRASDPDGVAEVDLFYAVEGRNPRSIRMTRVSGGADDGFYEASVPGQSRGVTVQIWAEARDARGGETMVPSRGPDSRALYRVDDGRSEPGQLHNFRIIMTTDDAAFQMREVEVMSNEYLPCTVVYREREVFYDVGCKLKGSQRGRVGGSRVSFTLRLGREKPFRGVHRTVSTDRAGGWGIGNGPTGQDEIVLKHLVAHAGDLPGQIDDLVYLIAPRSAQDTEALLQMAKFSNEYLDESFPDGSDGRMWKQELIYHATTTNAQGFKRPQPDGVIGTDLRNLGDDEESYRWNYLIENQRDEDNYAPIMEFAQLVGSSTAELDRRAEEVMDVSEILRMYVCHSLCGVTDTYILGSNAHNLVFYQRPHDGRFLFFHWDQDFAWSRSSSHALWGGENITRLLQVPRFQRIFWSHLWEITENTYNQGYFQHWTRHYGELTGEESIFNRIQSYIGQRRNFARGRLPTRVGFSITSRDNQTVDTRSITIAGRGWIDIESILVAEAGEAFVPRWSDLDDWEIEDVPLVPGANALTFLAFDKRGNLVGSDELTVTSTAEPAGPVFIRGDANGDGTPDISDAIFLLRYLFAGDLLDCLEAGDVDDSAAINLTDPVYLLNFLFLSGPPPAAPFPRLGEDPDPESSLGCDAGP